MTKSSRTASAREVAGLMRAFDASLDLLDESAAGALKIGRSDLRAMEFISRSESTSPSQLATALRLTTGSVTALLDRLERAGLVRRSPDGSDRRRVSIALTPDGKLRERRLFEPLARQIVRTLARYRPMELGLIADYLRRVTAISDSHRERIRHTAFTPAGARPT